MTLESLFSWFGNATGMFLVVFVVVMGLGLIVFGGAHLIRGERAPRHAH